MSYEMTRIYEKVEVEIRTEALGTAFSHDQPVRGRWIVRFSFGDRGAMHRLAEFSGVLMRHDTETVAHLHERLELEARRFIVDDGWGIVWGRLASPRAITR